MAIYLNDNDQVQLDFGSGDILVTSAYFNYYDGDKVYGIVSFEQSNDGYDVGEPIDPEYKWDLNKQEVIMTFENVSSIDVLIKNLQHAKQCMLDNE